MNRGTQILIVGMAGLLGALAMAGCEDTSEDASATRDVSGSWLYSDTDGNSSTWALVQLEDGTLTGAGTDGATISGSTSADSISMSLTYSSTNSAISLTGTVASDTAMSGTLVTAASSSGSWAAVKTN